MTSSSFCRQLKAAVWFYLRYYDLIRSSAKFDTWDIRVVYIIVDDSLGYLAETNIASRVFYGVSVDLLQIATSKFLNEQNTDD